MCALSPPPPEWEGFSSTSLSLGRGQVRERHPQGVREHRPDDNLSIINLQFSINFSPVKFSIKLRLILLTFGRADASITLLSLNRKILN